MAKGVNPSDWPDRTAPTLDDFEAMALTALESLPEPFRGMVKGVPCAVAEFPEDDVLDEMGFKSPFDLMGLFYGVGLPQGGAMPHTGQMPNRIWLYRRPILDYWAEHGDEMLGQIITHVLLHEIGHHFGFSDEDMEELERRGEAEDEANR